MRCNFCSLTKEQLFEIKSDEHDNPVICNDCLDVYYRNNKHDWDSFKQRLLYSTQNSHLHYFEFLESEIESPIERIANVVIDQFAKTQYGAIFYDRQFQIGNYRVDFMVEYRPTGKKLVIECDGHDFHEKTKEQASKDKERERFITKQGYAIFRYSGSDICRRPEKVISDIKEYFDTKHYVVSWEKIMGISHTTATNKEGV